MLLCFASIMEMLREEFKEMINVFILIGNSRDLKAGEPELDKVKIRNGKC